MLFSNEFLILPGCNFLPLVWREGRRGRRGILPAENRSGGATSNNTRRISRSGHLHSASRFQAHQSINHRKLFLDARSIRRVLRHGCSSSVSKHHNSSQRHVEVFAGFANSIALSSCRVSIYLQIFFAEPLWPCCVPICT
jgi:hypothetical protein